MPINLANAPVSWGVDYADDPKNPAWDRVMSEIAEAGYRHTELGPYGYYPTEPERLHGEFTRRGLTVAAGFVFQVLHDPAKREDVLDVATRTVALLAAVGGRHLVTIDHISEERMRTAGRADLAQRLDAPRRRHMLDLIERIADMALARGVTPVIHQHAGCYIEFEDEIEAVAAALDPAKVGLCIDTGHMAYAGIDPVAFYRRHASRVKYFHFKDIDRAIHARVVAERVPFLEAVAQKVFCPLGRGVVDWPGLASALRETGFAGAATIEQDIDPTVSLTPIEDARASLAYLRSVGF
ncbi:TIM barrel protein [Labrys wisconsinensis]|uniref:Inosose dehydratase n=1 Tax=Labrys wisconsinensis TaxID=425677 RepID=A0ABU0JIA5_9HYPH|nr:TIM barrel protein [Labrys wisconsinensis]MDQ0474024.1 inosose dehydratase [Labrys wisconsinensis]